MVFELAHPFFDGKVVETMIGEAASNRRASIMHLVAIWAVEIAPFRHRPPHEGGARSVLGPPDR
jgi:hypothetical protein